MPIRPIDRYVVPDQEHRTHRIMQDLGSRGIQEAIQEHNEILCESCDRVIGSVGSILNVGDKCWSCGARIVSFQFIM